MKQLLLYAVIFLTAFTSCQKNNNSSIDTPGFGITLQLTVPESSVVQTKAQTTDEKLLNNLWVFVFDNTGTLKERSKTTNLQDTPHTAQVSLEEGPNLGIYFAANVGAMEEAMFNAFTKGTTTLAQLKAINTSRSVLTAPGLPMWGELTNQTITNATKKLDVTLTRSCSRVDVVANSVANFTLLSLAMVLKTANNAPIFPSAAPVEAAKVVDFMLTTPTDKMAYVYENSITAADEAIAETKATAVIVRGTYNGIDGFYKLRIKYDVSGATKYDINRNTIYTINITSVKAPGFTTLAEAEANFPQNVDYNVTAIDADAHDLFVSNGQYYLGVSNTVYETNVSGAQTNVVVATVTHNAPTSITKGTITVKSGTGVTLKTTEISTTTQKQEIKVGLAASFTNTTITLRLGNLIKDIVVQKSAAVDFRGGVMTLNASGAWVGELDESTPDWLKLGKTNATAEDAQRVYSTSGLYRHITPNIGDNRVVRKSGYYFSGTGSAGRTRAIVEQTGAVLKYVSGVPTTQIEGSSPAPFTVTVNTDLAGWTIKAYEGLKDDKNKPIALTFGTKTGTPVLGGTPVNCTVPVTMSNNSGAQRDVQFYLSCSELPTMEIWCGAAVQKADLPNIAVTPTTQTGISKDGASYTVKVTSNSAWVATSTDGITFTPNSGNAGTDVSVVLKVPANSVLSSRSVVATFTATLSGKTATATWTGTQAAATDYLVGNFAGTIVTKTVGSETHYYYSKQLYAAAADESSTYQWATASSTTGATDIFDGKGNTVKLNSSDYPAAYACAQKSPAGTWHLPAQNQLMAMWIAKPVLGSFANLYYWSSTENGSNSSWVVGFTNGTTYYSSVKSSNFYVRCVREVTN